MGATQLPYLNLPQGCGKVNARVDFLSVLKVSPSILSSNPYPKRC